MNSVNWRSLDLNLLVTFVTLMETRSVTLAAEKLSLGQSAMSHSLGRLRKMLNDPLFVRQGHQMAPTFRATELYPVVKEVLATVANKVLNQDDFDPEQFQGAVRIGLTDYAELVFASSLFDAFGQAAPLCQLSLRPVDRENCYKALTNDEVDVVIGAIPDILPDVDTALLYKERHVCLFDAQATGLHTPLSLPDYLVTPHALVSTDGKLSSPVDKSLSELGYHRQVAVGSQRFLTVRHLLKGRNLLCTVAELMALLDSFNDNLTISDTPIEVAGFDIRLGWHSHLSEHPKVAWVRKLVGETVTSRVAQLKATNG